MKHGKMKELFEEVKDLDREVAAMDEHYEKALISGQMTDEELEVHRTSRNKILKSLTSAKKKIERLKKKIRTP